MQKSTQRANENISFLHIPRIFLYHLVIFYTSTYIFNINFFQEKNETKQITNLQL